MSEITYHASRLLEISIDVLCLVFHVIQYPFLVTSHMKSFAKVPEIQYVSVWHK